MKRKRYDWYSLSPYVSSVVAALINTGAVTATKFVSERETVRASRMRERGKINQRIPIQICLTLGPPNYTARKFVKLCRKAGEPFPVQKIQLTFSRVTKKKTKKKK